MSFANRDSSTSSFSIWMPFYFSCLTALAKTSSPMLTTSRESEHPHLVPDNRGRDLFFTIEDDISCGIFIYVIYYVEVFSFYSLFVFCFFFNHERVLNSVKCFFWIYWDYLVVLVVYPVNAAYSFSYAECPYIPRIKPTWLLCIILLMCSSAQLPSILLKIFAVLRIHEYTYILLLFSIFHQRHWSFSCSYSAFVWLRYQGDAGLKKWIWKYSFLFEFLEEIEKKWC